MSYLKELLTDRKITKAQHKAALNLSTLRLTNAGNLWGTNEKGVRVLIDRKGKVVFDGKKLIW